MHRRAAICMAFAVMLAGCQRAHDGASSTSAAAAAAPGTTSVAYVEGISWFDGGIDAAFEAAKAQDRPVFLYWGAEWCPPCHDLKAYVFPRPDFQQALQQFVPVYLDGDAPGAQRIAATFRVQGYPSVVVLTPDGQELARISGGSDLASYAQVLDLALESALPVEQILADAGAGRRLDAAECRRLAWNDWSMWTDSEAALAGSLQQAAGRCPAGAQVERDRLRVQAADLASAAERAAIEGGAAPGPLLAGLLREVEALLADPARSRDAGNALLYLGEDFFIVARHVDPAAVPQLRQQYFALLDAVQADERQSDTLRLLSAARRVRAARALDPAGAVPPQVATRARATLNTFLDRDHDAGARAGIVNSAAWVLHELGDDLQLRALLEEQMKHSRTPYYYMPDIADIEERAGNPQAALQWLERGYRESRGPATRFQWGVLYLNGLLRMAPDEAERIVGAVLEVIGELDGPDRIHARTRTRLERLDGALDAWVADTGNADALATIATRWKRICADLPSADTARAGCADLLG